MRCLTILPIIASAFILTNCSSTPDLPADAEPASISSYSSGFDYLTVTAVDGKKVSHSSSIHRVTPGNKKISYAGVFKGNALNNSQIKVYLEPGNSYSLTPSLGQLTERKNASGSDYYAENISAKIINDLTGQQIYPPLPKEIREEYTDNNELLPEPKSEPVYTVEEVPSAPAPRKKYNFEVNPEGPVQRSTIYSGGTEINPIPVEKATKKRFMWY